MKRILAIIGLIFLGLFLVISIRTLLFTSEKPDITAVEPAKIDEESAITRLSRAIHFKTISYERPEDFDYEEFLKFHRYLENAFPLTHQSLKRHVINKHSLLYEWKGSDASLQPAVYLAHIDVVPVEPGTEKEWSYDAFSGDIAEGFIWGRGTMDVKCVITALLETSEYLLQEGYRPKRTIYFALGHDEEVSGKNGAGKIAEYMKTNGIRPAFTLDEGMMILDERLSPTKKQLAIIGLTEKGFVTLKFSVESEGGHSSMPPMGTTLGILTSAISRLEKNQMPASLKGVAGQTFDTIGPDLPFIQKVIFANRWLTNSLVLSQLEKSNGTNAMIRTTTAPTVISGGVKDNVLPTKAHALVNFRILPGDTVDDVLAHANKVVADPRVTIEIHGDTASNPAPVSSTESEGYAAIIKTINEIFPGVSITPGLVVGGTDSKNYIGVVENSYRFLPVIYSPEDPKRLHGTNERVAIDSYLKMVQFYIQLMKNVSGG